MSEQSSDESSTAKRAVRWATVLLIIGLLVPRCHAQSLLDEVHTLPRNTVSSLGLAGPSPDSSLATLKVDASLVLVPVTITDQQNRLVKGLGRDNFQLFEDKKAQELAHVSSEDAPVSVGLIVDVSRSMSTKIERAHEAVREFLKLANPLDEFFMITFSDRPEEAVDFTQSVDDIQNQLLFALPRGRTALLDAIYLGVSKMRMARYHRRALLIISDGGDNRSRYTEREIKSIVKEADVLIYAIGIYDAHFPTQEELLGPELLSNISQLTGGRTYTIDNPNYLPQAASAIATELRNQYVLSYRPGDASRNGKWRKIRVKLKLDKGFPPLSVFARSGYYAATK